MDNAIFTSKIGVIRKTVTIGGGRAATFLRFEAAVPCSQAPGSVDSWRSWAEFLVLRQAQDEEFYSTALPVALILSLSKDEGAASTPNV
jgi:hypothetical protein